MDRFTVRQRISTIITTVIIACLGVTGFASADSIINTGPNSLNTIKTTEVDKCTITNNNNVDITQTNKQDAVSGDAIVTNNTLAGSAETGDAINENISEVIVNISNDSAFIGPTEGAIPAPILPLLDECGNPISILASERACARFSECAEIFTANRCSFSDICSCSYNYNAACRSFSKAKNRFPKNRVGGGFGQGQGGFGAGFGQGGFGQGGPAKNYNAPPAAVEAAEAPAAACASASCSACASASCSSCVSASCRSCVSCASARVASISNTGPSSKNIISSNVSSTTTVNNTNNVSYSSNNNQAASSGNAVVADNTTAGGAGTGTAANGNETSASVNISN